MRSIGCSLLCIALFFVHVVYPQFCNPTCWDGIQNGIETGIDCGGNCTSCAAPQATDVWLVQSARCDLRSTSSNVQVVDGFFEFSPNPGNIYTGQEPTWLLDIRYTINGGLTAGDHRYHIHNLGNMISPDGYSTEEHFIGSPASGSRPAGSPEIGLLNADTPIPTDGDNAASGAFSDNQARLNELNSILGRALVIHDTQPDGTLSRSGQCVVSRVLDSNTIKVPDAPTINRAVCVFEPADTVNYPDVKGFFQFKLNIVKKLDVKVFLSGLPAGTHTIWVHSSGDLSTATPSPIFVGDADITSVPVGYIGGQASSYTPDASGFVQRWFVEANATLNGQNSIIGRSLLIHLNGAANTIIGRCVVGVTEGYGTFQYPEGDYFPAPTNTSEVGVVPTAIRGLAYLRPTPAAALPNLKGWVEFRQTPLNYPKSPNSVRIHYAIHGLTPDAVYVGRITTEGDLGTTRATIDGTTLGPAFQGYDVVPSMNRPNVGDLPLTITASAAGSAFGQLFDPAIMLNNYNNIVGRGFVLVDNSTDIIVAYGVIGVTETAPVQTYDRIPATAATCLFWPTANGPAGMTGTVTFTQAIGATSVNVNYQFTGLTASTAYTWHVHVFGDIYDQAGGLATGGHFLGDAARRPNNDCEAGALNNGASITTSGAGAATGAFTDSFIGLNGINGIIGRSIVMHAPGGARVAQCLIGVSAETTGFVPAPEQIHNPIPDDDGPCVNCNDEDDDESATVRLLPSLFIFIACLFMTRL